MAEHTSFALFIALRGVPDAVGPVFCRVEELRPGGAVEHGRTDSQPGPDIDFSRIVKFKRYHGKKQTFWVSVYASADPESFVVTGAQPLAVMECPSKALLQGMPDGAGFFPPLLLRLSTPDNAPSEMSIIMTGQTATAPRSMLGSLELSLDVQGLDSRRSGAAPNPCVLICRVTEDGVTLPSWASPPLRASGSGPIPSFTVPISALIDPNAPLRQSIAPGEGLDIANRLDTQLQLQVYDFTDDEGPPDVLTSAAPLAIASVSMGTLVDLTTRGGSWSQPTPEGPMLSIAQSVYVQPGATRLSQGEGQAVSAGTGLGAESPTGRGPPPRGGSRGPPRGKPAGAGAGAAGGPPPRRDGSAAPPGGRSGSAGPPPGRAGPPGSAGVRGPVSGAGGMGGGAAPPPARGGVGAGVGGPMSKPMGSNPMGASAGPRPAVGVAGRAGGPGGVVGKPVGAGPAGVGGGGKPAGAAPGPRPGGPTTGRPAATAGKAGKPAGPSAVQGRSVLAPAAAVEVEQEQEQQGELGADGGVEEEGVGAQGERADMTGAESSGGQPDEKQVDRGNNMSLKSDAQGGAASSSADSSGGGGTASASGADAPSAASAASKLGVQLRSTKNEESKDGGAGAGSASGSKVEAFKANLRPAGSTSGGPGMGLGLGSRGGGVDGAAVTALANAVAALASAFAAQGGAASSAAAGQLSAVQAVATSLGATQGAAPAAPAVAPTVQPQTTSVPVAGVTGGEIQRFRLKLVIRRLWLLQLPFLSRRLLHHQCQSPRLSPPPHHRQQLYPPLHHYQQLYPPLQAVGHPLGRHPRPSTRIQGVDRLVPRLSPPQQHRP